MVCDDVARPVTDALELSWASIFWRPGIVEAVGRGRRPCWG